MSPKTESIEAERRASAKLFFAIGEFIFEFSQLEFTIRHVLGAALDLGDDRFDAITSSYDFAELCRVTDAVIRPNLNARPMT